MFCDTGDTVAHLNFRHVATIHATFFGPHNAKAQYDARKSSYPAHCRSNSLHMWRRDSNTVVCSSINNHTAKVINGMTIRNEPERFSTTNAVSSTEI